jgi:hypothetical protein
MMMAAIFIADQENQPNKEQAAVQDPASGKLKFN